MGNISSQPVDQDSERMASLIKLGTLGLLDVISAHVKATDSLEFQAHYSKFLQGRQIFEKIGRSSFSKTTM